MTLSAIRVHPDACNALGHGSTTFYKRVESGLLPPPFKLGARASALLSTEIEAIIRARAAGSTDEEIRLLVKLLTAARREPTVQAPRLFGTSIPGEGSARD